MEESFKNRLFQTPLCDRNISRSFGCYQPIKIHKVRSIGELFYAIISKKNFLVHRTSTKLVAWTTLKATGPSFFNRVTIGRSRQWSTSPAETLICINLLVEKHQPTYRYSVSCSPLTQNRFCTHSVDVALPTVHVWLSDFLRRWIEALEFGVRCSLSEFLYAIQI